MDFDDIRIEKLRQKILRFNGLIEELSQEFTAIILEGNKEKFHDVILEMIYSLEKSQETVKTVYSLVLGEDKAEG
ncbi:MAG: hypothetical protein ACW98F_00590 [Candidatus Hodarchaeales archaeon]|jgi:hypothetical protein